MTKLRELLGMDNQTSVITVESICIALITAAVCGLIVYFVYRFFYRGVVYSDNFGMLIVLISVITSFIILTIGANLVLSLGMVGALSIVRFRAAVKDPLDVGFLYWAVAAGLTAGAGLPIVSLLGTTAVALLYILMVFMRKDKRSFLLILRYGTANEAEVDALLATLKYKLKNRSRDAEQVELTAEVKLRRNDQSELRIVMDSPLVDSASLVEFVGDYT